MEYLELVLLITVIVTLFKREQEKVILEDKVSDIEGKLDGIEKLLVELQPKGPVEIPVRLDDEVVNVIMDVTKQDMEEYQVEKAEFQEKMKDIDEKYNKPTPIQIVKEYWDEYNEKKYTSEERLDGLPEKTKQDIREYIEKQIKQKQGKK
jgi:hypothetical protein